MSTPELEVRSLTTRYGAIRALRDASLTVGAGEVVFLIGPNGAGKTTLLNTVIGLLRPTSGQVLVRGEDVTGSSPDSMITKGVALVPEHRRIFADLTVRENLLVAGITLDSATRERRLGEMVELFPLFEQKWTTSAGYLSGGEAQQLAIARALMSDPEILLMDEPSLGLAPTLVDLVFELLARLRDEGRTMLIVEQNAQRALEIADRAYVLRSGEIIDQGTGAELRERTDLVSAYFGSEQT